MGNAAKKNTVVSATVSGDTATVNHLPGQPSTDVAFEAPSSLYDFTLPLTADAVETRVTDLMVSADAVYQQLELRVQADNGKLYHPSWALPQGVNAIDANGLPVDVMEADAHNVNVNAFDTRDLLGCIVNKFERKLELAEARVTKQRGFLRSLLTAAARNDVTVTEARIETCAAILERMIEQQALGLVAFRAAAKAYGQLTGEEFETATMRAERVKIGEVSAKQAVGGKFAHLLG